MHVGLLNVVRCAVVWGGGVVWCSVALVIGLVVVLVVGLVVGLVFDLVVDVCVDGLLVWIVGCLVQWLGLVVG